MVKELKIRQRDDIDIQMDILSKAKYVGSGASKETYALGETVYKLPIGYCELDKDFLASLKYPYEMEDFQELVGTIYEYHEGLVWSIGQIVLEIMVWEHMVEFEKKGYDLSGFARIKDYYIDKNGILVIEQEYVHHSLALYVETYSYDFYETNKPILDALKNQGFELSDLSAWNMTYNDNKEIKCFDFGLSRGSYLYSYDTYEDYCSYSGSYDSYSEEEDY